jgi:hypothetical protein
MTYKGTGYSVFKAEMGQYHGVKARHEAFQVFNEFLIKKTETQGGTSSAALHRLHDWNVPLMMDDGRDPPPITKEDAGSASQAALDRTFMKPQVKKKPTPLTSPKGAPPTAGPKQPDHPPDWVIATTPTGIETQIYSGKDYYDHDYSVALLLSGVNFVCSHTDGPHASNFNLNGPGNPAPWW